MLGKLARPVLWRGKLVKVYLFRVINRCSINREYILPADTKFPNEVKQLNNLPKAKKEFPRLKEVPSQVLQQAIKQLHRGWEYFQ